MRTVSATVEIAQPPEITLAAFTSQKMLGEWWGVERCMVDRKPGGIYLLAWGVSEQGIRYLSSGVINAYEPGRLLQIGHYMYVNAERPFLGPQQLQVQTTAFNGGTLLELTQGPYPEQGGEHWDWYYDAVKDAWPRVLQQLKQYLETTTTFVDVN